MNSQKTSFRKKFFQTLDVGKNTLRYGKLALNKQLVKMPLAEITDEFAFSLAPDGWNYFSVILDELSAKPEIALENTLFYKFFTHPQINQIQTLNELLTLGRPNAFISDGHPFYLGTYPWGGLTPDVCSKGGTPFGWYYDQVSGEMTRDLWGYKKTLWYQPNDRYTIEFDWNLTAKYFSSIKKGYKPIRFLSFPSVSLLVRHNGEQRGIIVDGHHRLPILKYLGYKEVRVEITQVIREEEIDDWYYVKRKICSKSQALEIFQSFFLLNGKERLDHLQLHKK